MKGRILYFLIVIGGVLLASTSFAKSNSTKALYSHPYVIVYGRDSCPFTKAMRKSLDFEGIKYQYKIIDKPEVRNKIFSRMKARHLPTKDFTLPVVDVSNKIFVHPEPAIVIDYYTFGNTNE